MSKLYCSIRHTWVAALPEECVRQELLLRMMEQLGYPKGLLVVEKGLAALQRRTDILCYGKEHSELFPLLLIECKAIPLSAKTLNQVIGYNAHVKARYIAIANQTEVRTGWYDPKGKEYRFVERLPAYAELI